MKTIKKLFLLTIICLLSLSSFSHAGIVGVTRWVKGDKKVCIFFDNHGAGSASQNLAHFAHIKETILDQAATREKPLDILVENYMHEPEYRQVAKELEAAYGYDQRFLQMFDDWVDRDLGGSVNIKSIDGRVVPFLTFTLFCEWQKRMKGNLSMPDDLYITMNEVFNELTFGQVFAHVNKIDPYIEGSPSQLVKEIFLKQKSTLIKHIGDAIGILLSGGYSVEEINRRPIKDIWEEKITLCPTDPKRQAWDNLFINHNGTEFWPIDLLWQITDANILWETLNAVGDVAIFTGCYHAVTMENCLRDIGYRQTGVAKKQQVEVCRKNFAGGYQDVEMDLITFAAYAWI